MNRSCVNCLKSLVLSLNFLCWMIHSKFASLITSFWPIYPANTLVVTGTIVTCFFVLLFVLMLVELAMACVFLVYSRKIDAYFEEDLMRSLDIYRQSSSENNTDIKKDFDTVHYLFRCCGVHGEADWKGDIPISCCTEDPCNTLNPVNWPEGCLVKLRDWFASNYVSTGAGVVTLFIIQVQYIQSSSFICLSITVPLFCHISRSGLGY
ncbi:hypothetical protein F7725_013356, partial [Dissostichus mawsoni]